jgi:hypothetical protein
VSDPRRLVEADGTEFERRLLLSAQSEQPPPALVRRMEGALGIAAVAAAGTSVAVAAPAVAAAPKVIVEAGPAASVGAVRAAAASSPVGAVTLPLVLKAVGLGSLVVAGAVVVNLWMSRPARPPAMGPGAPAPLIVPAPEPVPAPAATAAPQALAPAAVVAPPRAPAIAATSDARRVHTGASALRGEIALIDGARAALAGGSPARAIQILAQHDARYPRGVLVPEAQALRIEALMASGQRRRARSLARAFLAAHPSSPLAERIARVRDGEETR